MISTPIAIGIWVLLVTACGFGWFLTDALLLRRYEERTGRPVSHGSRFARFVRDPVLAVRSLKSDLDTVGDARDMPSDDSDTEWLRRTSSQLLLATIIVGFAGLPVSILAVGMFVRLSQTLGLSLLAHVVIVGLWILLGVATLKRSDRSRAAVLFVLAGLVISILFGLTSMLSGTAR